MLDENRRATLARVAPVAGIVAPVLLSGVAYRGIIWVKFHLDDHVHLYDIVNLGLQSILINFAGHLYLTRNTVLLALHAVFGMNTPATMTFILLNHLVCVALLFCVIRAFTGNVAVASVVAAWWGAAATNTETLAWYAVYGQVLVVTAILCVLILVARVARGEPLGMPGAVAATLGLLAAASSFGTGLAMTLAMPAALWVMLPAASPGRTRLLWAASIAAVTSVVLYGVTALLNQYLFGKSSVVMPEAQTQWLNAVVGLGHLWLSGAAVALTGPWYLPLQALGLWTKLVAGAVAVAIMVAARRRWRAIVGFLLLTAAPYGLIGIARFRIVDSAAAEAALSGRYHYVAPLGAVIALAIAIAALLDRFRDRGRAQLVFATVGYAVAVAGYLCCFPPIPTHDAVQFQVDQILAQTIGTIRAHPPGDVYIRQRPFFLSDLATLDLGDKVITVPPGRFPGTPALFALYHDKDVFEGRRVYFVVTDPAKVRAWQRGRRGTKLIMSWSEMLERTGQGSQSPTSGGAAPNAPR